MQGSSRISQGTARERLETLLASGGDAKAALVGRLLDGKVDPAVVDLVASLVRSRWTGARDLGQTAEELAVSAVVAGAESAGRADRVEDELFRFERTVDGDPQLASALADRTASAQRKRQLVADLLHDKVAPETEVLVDRVVLHPRGQHLARALVELGRLASERRQQLVANVIVALPLDVDQHDRLAAALQRMYGKTVHLNVDVVPDVLGGIRVEVGDEVLDGTVSRRLDDVRRSLGG
jgi:F-type H+-transporting ATPase subunit delta